MNIVSIEPTPNPNSMKINLDEKLDPGKKYTFIKKDKERCPVQFKDILDIDGVTSIFRVADFLSVQRHPSADWEEILARVRTIIEGVSHTTYLALLSQGLLLTDHKNALADLQSGEDSHLKQIDKEETVYENNVETLYQELLSFPFFTDLLIIVNFMFLDKKGPCCL